MNQLERKVSAILAVVTMIAACMTLGTAPVLAQQKPLKMQLAGAWTLVSVEVTSKDGSKRPGFGGPNAKGILILDSSGRYAQVTGRPDRPKLSTTNRQEIPAAELGESARSFGAGFGTWTIDEPNKMLTLKTELSTIPNNDGNETNSSVKLAGDELRRVVSRPGGGATEFVYRRAK
jgi:hypothetical protein